MRDFLGMQQFIDDNYAKSAKHRFHALGCQLSDDFFAPGRYVAGEKKRFETVQPWATQADMAWTLCLHRAKIIGDKIAARLLDGLDKTRNDPLGVSGEERLVKVFDGDMDTASIVNYGRTLQEPMSRLRLRDKLLDVLDDIFALLETTHRLALENLDTLMVGHTHMNHGQPITYAHFMVGSFDVLTRGLKQLEMAYSFTNVNTGGCGACSGITWPVDREYLAELLGFDGVMESTYDCEATQDHSLAILSALSNIALHVSRCAMNHYIWAFDEIDMIRTHPSMCGMSSFMPQKCDPCSLYEHVRICSAEVMGETVKGMLLLKSEPYADVQSAHLQPFYTIAGMLSGQNMLRRFDAMLRHMIINKDRMRAVVRAGYSCATEVASYLIREKGYGGRLAHSITATMVRKAREKGLKSYECTGELLDEAARYLDVREPDIDTATLQKCLDPDHFLQTHTHLGGTAPQENSRLLKKRRALLDEARSRHKARREQVALALEKLKKNVAEICKAASDS